jgi:hypothetical protein
MAGITRDRVLRSAFEKHVESIVEEQFRSGVD